MSFAFTDTRAHRFESGQIYLGRDPVTHHDIGLSTERHAITIAGAGSGKGAGLIIPNLLRWPRNVLCIDPKGENAAASWAAREDMGQTVYVLDPFKIADVPDRLRATCNLLASIRPDGLTAREDIRVIADGLVMRHKAEDAVWDNGAVSVLSGLIAYVLADPAPEGRTLPAVRSLLTLPPDTLREVFAEMSGQAGYGNLAKAAASIGLSDTKKNQEFVGGARDHSEWMDSAPMAAMLSASSLDLSVLKTGNASVFLVLPPEYLGEHGRFLRLFVRCALDAMAKGLTGEKCLFILDEFFTLGRIDEIAKAAGLMRGYGVQLWPFLQDFGQLSSLYGRDGAQTFFGNADAHIFFGNTDTQTLGLISAGIGILSMEEIGPAPVHIRSGPMNGQGIASMFGADHRNRSVRQSAHMMGGAVAGMGNMLNSLGDAMAQHEMNEWQAKASKVGKARLAPDVVRELVAKKDGDQVARSMIVFGKGGDVFNLRLAPYFLPAPEPVTPPEKITLLSVASMFAYWLAKPIDWKAYGRRTVTFLILLAPWLVLNFIAQEISASTWGTQAPWSGSAGDRLVLTGVVIDALLLAVFYRRGKRRKVAKNV